MAWYDDLYDKASNLVSKADANELFGINEAGLFNDIGLIDDLKKNALGRALRGVDADTSGAGINDQRKPMYGSTDPASIPPDLEPTPVEEEIREPFVPSEYKMNMPAKLEMQYGGQQKRRSPDRVGGPPVETYGTQRQRMVLDDGSEEEERRRMIAALRRNQGYV